ncbi:MAG: cadherin-like beta sandwich domain-containing protein [Lachnospiraceae bacterium]|nr:cadherin-like beta sandwich domain-containing protein [Lachnospiraceae bacterium]
MATIGLDNLYYAKITEDTTTGAESYGSPVKLAKAISADLSVELAEATLYADDGASEVVKEFKSGTISLGIDELGSSVAADLLGVTVDTNGVVVSTAEDGAPLVAIGFRAKKSNNKYKYFWLYRVKFGIPGDTQATKGDSIAFNTPKIDGTVMRRNKADGAGNHPWKVEVTDGVTGVSATTITNWFNSVYEPSYNDTGVSLSALTIGSISLSPTFAAGTTSYTASTTNATNTVTATAADNTASVAITVNGNSLTNGGSATWATGANTVLVTVTKGSASKTYTITVTKS